MVKTKRAPEAPLQLSLFPEAPISKKNKETKKNRTKKQQKKNLSSAQFREVKEAQERRVGKQLKLFHEIPQVSELEKSTEPRINGRLNLLQKASQAEVGENIKKTEDSKQLKLFHENQTLQKFKEDQETKANIPSPPFQSTPEIKRIEKNKEPKENDFLSLLDQRFIDSKETNEIEEILINDIKGLIYVRNFMSRAEQEFLLKEIDREPWLTELTRRVQHYGYKYDYKKHEINSSMYIAPLPEWALKIAQRIHEKYSSCLPDQVIVNEYEPGQGISSHTDCKSCFKDTIISLSLGSKCVMDFIAEWRDEKKSILLEPGSLIVMQGEARDKWKHGIAKRKTDNFQGQLLKRERRVSLTFRTVILPNSSQDIREKHRSK